MTIDNINSKLAPELLDFLETTPLFHGISREMLDSALAKSTVINLKQGHKLLSPLQINQHVYIILSGRLSIQFDDANFNPIAMFGQGECVGEMSMLGDGRATSFVIAASDCDLLAVDHASLWNLINNSHEAAGNLLRTLSQRIKVSDQLMAESFEAQHGYVGLEIIDNITGLYNRHWMHKELTRYLQRCLVDKKYSCLILLEMDEYQRYAGSHGELGGDQALRTIAFSILSCLRPDDMAGHYLGAKFIVFLPNTTSLDSACIAAERLRSGIQKADIVLPTGDVLPRVNVSIGVCQMKDDGLPGLLARTEDALQKAKHSGGNCVAFL
jgi:diguanylate cyclase (GGDEF)-like protein